MKMYMIASLYQGDKRLGFRILDSDTGKIIDVTEIQVIGVLKTGQKIINLELSGNKLQGSNGGIDRYAKIVDGRLAIGDKGPVVILNQLGDTGYTISDHNGKIMRAKTSDVIQYASKNGIANGKISTRNNLDFISAISGTYERIELQHKQNQDTEIKQNIPESSKEIKSNDVEEAKDGLAFTEEQLYVLKKYYEQANISKSKADKEIELLNNLVLNHKEDYSKTPLVYEVLTSLGSSFNIGNAFGNELGSHLICFINVDLPFPQSLLEKCSQYLTENIANFYSVLFYGLENTVNNILNATEDTMSIAARLYLEYMASKEILGCYKEPDTDRDKLNKEFIKTYGLCSEYTFTELRAIIGAINLIEELSGSIPGIIRGKNLLEHKKELFYICNLYYKGDTTKYGSPSSHEKLALLEAIGYCSEYYKRDCWSYLIDLGYKEVVQEKDLKQAVHPEYQGCLFVSTPINRLNGVETEDNIKTLYEKQLKALLIGHDLILGRFNSFIHNLYSEVDTEIERIKREEMEKQREKRLEEARKEEERHKKEEEEARKIKEQAEKQENLVDKQENNTPLNKLQQDILNGGDLSVYDRIDLYKELKSRAKGPFTDICFVISEDMIARKLRYQDMSKRQKFRFDEAIAKLTKEVTGIDSIEKQSDKVNTVTNNENKSTDSVNNSYTLEEHPEIKTNIEELLSKADSVEMSTVLKEEPVVLKICYSILKYKKASDKQLKHVNRAIELLHNQ